MRPDTKCSRRGFCHANEPICADCGRVWEYYHEYSGKAVTVRVYTSAKVVAKYRAIYGDKGTQFFKVGE